MQVRLQKAGQMIRLLVNDPKPVVKFPFTPESDEEISQGQHLNVLGYEISFFSTPAKLSMSLKMELNDHFFGLGEKAFPLDRKRTKSTMMNQDASGLRRYTWGSDPLYVSIPFFIALRDGNATGFFVNSTSALNFDFGIARYDEVRVEVPGESAEVFLLEGPSMEQVVERYAILTGRPLDPPAWALGYQASRYSYFPQDAVVEVAKRHLESEVPLDAIYLDLDYMDERKIFTWGKDFPDPRQMIEKLHSMGTHLVTIVDHGIKLDQNYPLFASGLGKFVETSDGEIFVDRLWPGNCAYPDFFRKEARDWWSSLVKSWTSWGVDGIWLDMNEPTVLDRNTLLRFPENAYHVLDDGRRMSHYQVRNAYPLFQAMATYQALREVQDKPFVLSRAGYSGIQSYAFVWTGDNVSGEEDIQLQLQLIESLGLSGLPFAGCDLGGFIGRSSPDVVLKYYRAALFFPLYRNHKEREGNDQEPYALPNGQDIKRAIDMRRYFMPYMLALAREAHLTGHPVVRPLVYEFQRDSNTYLMHDEYMVGKSLLYAPQIYGESGRDIYVPEGRWASWWTGDVITGPKNIKSAQEFPLFLREGGAVPTSQEVRFFGPSRIELENGATAHYDGSTVSAPGFEKAVVYDDKGIHVLDLGERASRARRQQAAATVGRAPPRPLESPP